MFLEFAKLKKDENNAKFIKEKNNRILLNLDYVSELILSENDVFNSEGELLEKCTNFSTMRVKNLKGSPIHTNEIDWGNLPAVHHASPINLLPIDRLKQCSNSDFQIQETKKHNYLNYNCIVAICPVCVNLTDTNGSFLKKSEITEIWTSLPDEPTIWLNQQYADIVSEILL